MRNLRDPALLEYIGEGAIQASVFPIPPGEDRRIEIEYGEIVPVEEGLSRYRYPLNTERFSAQPLEEVSVHVGVETRDPLRAVYSPSHDVAVDRPDDFHFAAGYEASDVRPDTDFELFWSVSPDSIGASVVSYVDESTERGISSSSPRLGSTTRRRSSPRTSSSCWTPRAAWRARRSSRRGRRSSTSCEHLNPDDRFNVVEFSTGAREYARELVAPTEAEDAARWVERLGATGGTDINLALLTALDMVEPGRPTMILFLTDGLPTEGEIDTSRIIANVADAAPENVRLFAFGVGDDVDADPARYPLQRTPGAHDVCSPR